MKTRPGAAMCAGVKQGVNEVLIYLAVIPGRGNGSARGAARWREPGIQRHTTTVWIPGSRQEARPGMTDFVRQPEMLLIWLTV
jgi:hypothetical protein